MNEIIKNIIIEVEKFNESIVKTLDSKNISNTREAANSLYVEHGKDFVRSIGVFYLEFLDTGRAPGKFPPKKNIEDWVKTKKGISEQDPEFDQVVFLVQRKIAEVGTAIYINNRKGIELDKKIVTLRKAINESIKESVVVEVTQKLDEFKKKFQRKKFII